jgi:hypothetical protein
MRRCQVLAVDRFDVVPSGMIQPMDTLLPLHQDGSEGTSHLKKILRFFRAVGLRPSELAGLAKAEGLKQWQCYGTQEMKPEHNYLIQLSGDRSKGTSASEGVDDDCVV